MIGSCRVALRLSAVGLLVATLSGADDAQVEVGKVAPDFALLNADSMTVRLSEYRDRQPVVVVFSRAQWCTQSLKQVQVLQAKYPEFKQLGAEVMVVFRDDSARVEGLKRVRDDTKAGFVLLTDYEAQRTPAYSPDAYNAYVLDRRGVVRAVQLGTEALRPEPEKLLEAVRLLSAK